MTCLHREDANLLTKNTNAMKKLFSLCMATLLTMSMFAATKTVATVEKLWSGEVLGWAAADSRQWTGYGEYVYWESKANHVILGTKDGINVDTVIVNDKIDGTAFCVDGAGNWIVEGTFPNTPSHIFLVSRADTSFVDIPITGLGRCDIATATGDVFSAQGGVVFLYGNSVNLLAVSIKNAGAENQEVITKEIGIKGSNVQNFVVAGDTTNQYVQRRSSGQTGFYYYENGVDKGAIEGMTGYKATTLGGAMVELAGKTFAIYPAGTTNYSSEFSVANLTDGSLAVDKADASKTVFFANTATAANTTDVGIFANATKIDDNSAYIQVGNGSDGTALFKLNVSVAAEVVVACNEEQGSVTGGGDVAVGGNATVEATPKPGFEFVAWKNGDETVSTDAKYTFAVTENITLTAIFEAKENVTITLAVNNAEMGAITLPDGIVMGENSVVYGTPVELTAVPAEGATFKGWFKGEDLYSADYTIKLNGKESISLVATFVNVLTLAYELNGGVTNDSNWTSKGQLMLEIQNDYNAKYSASLAVVKEENGICYFKIGDDWKTEAEAQGQIATVAGFFQNKTWSTDQKCANLFLNNPKYQFLVDLIDHFRTSAMADRGEALLSEMTTSVADAYFRADVSGFMLNSPATDGYPYTCDWAKKGQPDSYYPVWGHAFANPEEIVAEITLNAPYKAGFTFDGWYAEEDFSGDKVTKVGPESKIPGNKLYAKWVEYIPTLAEISAMDKDIVTKAKGVVTYVNGKNAYIQDASAGMLLFNASANLDLQVGKQVVVKGKTAVYGGAPELAEVTLERSEDGTMPAAVALANLAAAKAEPLKYFGQLISFKGLTIVALDNYKNPSLSDGVDTVVCYKMSVDETKFPVGTKVNVTAIAGYFNGFQLVGDVAGIVEAPFAGKDEYNYPARGENGQFTLENKWLISNTLDNYISNRPAATNFCRGMAAKDGKMYFIDRGNAQIVVVDATTGKMLEPIKITGDHLFQKQDAESGEWKDDVTLAYNDIKFDNAGHCLVAACSGGDQSAYVYIVDLATGAATELINERIRDNEDNAEDEWRMDAIGVYGDVTSKAVVMFGNSMNKLLHAAYKWDINNGKPSQAERIDLVVKSTDDTYLWKNETELYVEDNSACQVFPVDFNYFYWDHHSCRPTLFNMDGKFIDDLKACPTTVVVANNAGDTCKVGSGHNGICEFQIGKDYFVIMAATNTAEVPASSFALFKFADEAKEFSGLTPLWFFPNDGMGSATNAYRTAVPTVEVNGNKATIYLYTGENGYGVYEMTGVADDDAVANVGMDPAIKAEKRIENGNLYIIRNGVRYNAQGVVAQ